MTQREKDLEIILARLEEQRPEIDRILNRKAIIDTGREPKNLCRIPKDVDFTEKDGHTEYEVVGHFNPDGEEYLLNTVVRKLGYKFHEET